MSLEENQKISNMQLEVDWVGPLDPVNAGEESK